MKKICPDCGCEFENRNFCPKCGIMGLTEVEYKAYKKALENASENAIEESMELDDSEKSENPIQSEPPANVKITDLTGFDTDDEPISEASDNDDIKEYSDVDKNDSKADSCQCSECNGTCHSYLDDDDGCNFDEDDEVTDLDCNPFDAKKIAKLAIGAACFIGAIIVAVKVVKRKK